MDARAKGKLANGLFIVMLVVLLLAGLCLGYYHWKSSGNKPVLQGGDSTSESADSTTETTQETTETTEETTQEIFIFTTYTGQFADQTENADLLEYHPEGRLFGWEDRLMGGCSTWCSVMMYDVTAIASSTLKPHGTYAYPASSVTMDNRDSAWSEGAEGSGIGEYIELEHTCLIGHSSYETDIGFTELCIVNGYAVTEKGWEENNRVKALKMYFKREYVATILLEDTILPQYIDISSLGLKVENGETANFRFEISEVYPGTRYDDTCITGLLLEFSGRTAH